MSTQKHLDIEFWCPLSGVKLETGIIQPHKMAVLQCENGALFARCPNHVARCFIADITTVKKVMEISSITHVTHGKSKNKQERNNAAS